MSRPHVLYRMFDEDGVLLYVGITDDPVTRFRGHRGIKSWWNQVCTITLERYSSRQELEDAERVALAAGTAHNVKHNPRARCNAETCAAQGHTPRSPVRRCAKCDEAAWAINGITGMEEIPIENWPFPERKFDLEVLPPEFRIVPPDPDDVRLEQVPEDLDGLYQLMVPREMFPHLYGAAS